MVTPDWCGTFWGSTPKGVPGLNQYIYWKDPHLHHKSTKEKVWTTAYCVWRWLSPRLSGPCAWHTGTWTWPAAGDSKWMKLTGPCSDQMTRKESGWISPWLWTPTGQLRRQSRREVWWQWWPAWWTARRRRPSRRSPLPCGRGLSPYSSTARRRRSSSRRPGCRGSWSWLVTGSWAVTSSSGCRRMPSCCAITRR